MLRTQVKAIVVRELRKILLEALCIRRHINLFLIIFEPFVASTPALP